MIQLDQETQSSEIAKTHDRLYAQQAAKEVAVQLHSLETVSRELVKTIADHASQENTTAALALQLQLIQLLKTALNQELPKEGELGIQTQTQPPEENQADQKYPEWLLQQKTQILQLLGDYIVSVLTYQRHLEDLVDRSNLDSVPKQQLQAVNEYLEQVKLLNTPELLQVHIRALHQKSRILEAITN